MSIASLVRLKIRQAIGGEKPRGLIKFLVPDFLVGIFLGYQSEVMSAEHIPVRVAVVAAGVVLFTCIAETRKLFFSGGDMERFYFVQSTISSRLASLAGVILLNLAVAAAIFIPVTLILSVRIDDPALMFLSFLVSVSAASSIYLIFLFFVAVLPQAAANRALTIVQILMALVLLGAFQLSARIDFAFDIGPWIAASLLSFILASVIFTMLPFSENLLTKLRDGTSATMSDLYALSDRLKRPFLIRSDDEEAGLMFFLANLFRNASFRLSTIGVAATPVMVAVYWSMQGVRSMTFSPFTGMRAPNFVAPMASLVVSGVVAFYFISQNILTSRDHEARWLFETRGDFNRGRFVLGIRKGLLIAVHVPVTIMVFLVAIVVEPLAVAAAVAATYYSLVHIAATWFSVMQRRMPFSVPFTRLGASETGNLLFMLAYSFLVTVVLVKAYGDPVKLLMVNLFAFILVGMLEYFSVRIVNKRMKPVV